MSTQAGGRSVTASIGLVLLLGGAAAAAAADRPPGSVCATGPETDERIRAWHELNRARIEAARQAGTAFAGTPNDRIVDDVIVLDDDGTLVVGHPSGNPIAVTDSVEILDRAVALVGDQYDLMTILVASTFLFCSDSNDACTVDEDCPGLSNECNRTDVDPEAGFAFYSARNTDIRGINRGPIDNPNFSRLLGLINMNDLGEYGASPDDDLPGFNGVVNGTEVLGQEAGHAWGSFVNTENADLLGRGNAHWSFYLQTYGSVMEGNFWIDNLDGTFTTGDASTQFEGFSQLDEYVMGLRAVDEITEEMFLVVDPVPSQSDSSFPSPGTTVSGTRVDVSPAEVVAFNGDRDPASPGAPRDFSMAFILVVPGGTDPSLSDMALMQQFRTSWEQYFFDETDSRGRMHTGLSDPVPVSAAFRAATRIGAAPLTVSFENFSHGDATSYLWDFGDGNTSTDAEPLHTYTANGDYAVSLTVDGAGGPVTTTVPDFVLVDDFVTVFEDDFETDQGWRIIAPNDATSGTWERAAPQEDEVNGTLVQPGFDHTPDLGMLAWVTGASPGDDVDDGSTTIGSPAINTIPYGRLVLSYARWYSTRGGGSPGRDVLAVDFSDDGGQSWTSLERPGESMVEYRVPTFFLDPLADPTVKFFVRVIASDTGSSSNVEAVIDDFRLLGILLPDGDSDGFPDVRDNCPLDANGTQADGDLDEVGDECDCAPADATLWGIPDDVGTLLLTHSGGVGGTTTLSWSLPSAPGAASIVYDTLRSDTAADFSGALCVETADGGDMTATDADTPPQGYFYLVRAASGCGDGPAGTDSAGTPRSLPACP